MTAWPWPWWAGALSLALLTVGYWWVFRRPLGVSGSVTGLLTAKSRLEAEAAEAAVSAAPDAFLAAMMAETQAHFGAAVRAEAEPVSPTPSIAGSAPRVGWSGQAVFLVGLVAGGLFSAGRRGELRLQTLGETHAALFGSGWSALAVLLAGGLLVGFGTRMSGGCTSGHGLSGCSRLQRGSLLATATFFGVAVVTSLALGRWL